MNKIMNGKLRNGYGLALIIVLILAFLAIYLQIKNNEAQLVLKNGYDRSFYELIEYLDNVETLLAKAQITSTPEYSAKTLTEIWREANLAESCLSQIPLTSDIQGNSLKFLNQVSDYSYSLSRKTIDNEELTEEDFKNLNTLYENCKNVNATLTNLSAMIASDDISWSELAKQEGGALFAQEVSNVSKEGFSDLQKNLQDYEGLIYDGPFSEHVTNKEPKGLRKEKYTEEMARKVIYSYVPKEKILNINYNGTVNGIIESYSYDIDLNNEEKLYINITTTGGHVLWMNYNKNIIEENLDLEAVKAKATEFLEAHGFNNMKESYYINEGNAMTINYAATINNVICYPDLIKVKVALDDGEIVGFEASSYLTSHVDRKIEKPKISIEEARKNINQKIQINSEGLAIIPTDWGTEVLAYEFKGKVEENDFIVYVNANTGKEENIFMIVDTPNGILAI